MTSLFALHGFTGNPDNWAFLGDNPTHFSAPALLGHAGAIDTDSVTTFEGEVDRLMQLAPPGDGLHVVGYSLGARLALGMAIRHPERVERLTLISGHPGLANDGERRARRLADSAWVELLLNRGVEAFVDTWEAQPLWATQAGVSDAARRRRRAARLSHEARGLARSLRVTGLGEMPSYWGKLAQLGMPVSVLAGELDVKFSRIARSLVDALRYPALEIVPGSGHDLLLERPEVVARVIRGGFEK